MNEPNRDSWHLLLNSTDLAEREELARRLGDQPPDPADAERTLLRAFVHGLPDELFTEVERSLLRLRGGLSEMDGGWEAEPEVHVSIYQDALGLHPSEYTLEQMLRQAQRWQPPTLAVWLARRVLEGAHVARLCGQAVGILGKNNELDPDWFLDYLDRQQLAGSVGNDENLLYALLYSLGSVADGRGWDDRRKREELMKYIRPAIRNANWGLFMGGRELMDWLARLGPPDETANLLREFLPNWSIGQHVPPYLSGLGEHGRPVLVEILEGGVNGGEGLASASVQPGLEAGLTVADILHALARNDKRQAVAYAMNRLLNFAAGPELRDALRQLPHAARSYLRDCLMELLESEALSEFENVLRSNFGGFDYSSTGAGLLRALQRAPDLRSRMKHLQRVFGDSRLNLLPSHDRQEWLRQSDVMTRLLPLATEMLAPLPDLNFGPLTGLALAEPLTFEYDGNLRFRYLVELGRVKGDFPVRYFIEDATGGKFNAETLVNLERGRDDLRDRVSLMRGELETWRRRTEWTADKEVPGFVRELEDEIVEMERSVDGERFEGLRRASEELVPKIAEAGVTFERWEPEGLLGEYRPTDHTVTIYTGMIRILAASPAMQGAGSFDEVERALIDLAEIHEAAHGHLISATTCDRESWQGYADTPYSLHEALVTAYTRRFAESLQPGGGVMTRVLDALEPLLPAEYRAARPLARLSGEDLRGLVIAARNSPPPETLAETTRDLLRVVNSKAGVLASLLGAEAYGKLARGVGDLSQELESAETPESLADACVKLFALFEDELPGAIPLVETLGGFDWPDARTLALRHLAALCKGPTVGTTSLRLRIDVIIADGPGPSAVAGYEDTKNAASMGLPDYEEALEDAGVAPDDPYFELLRERRKASESRRERGRGEG